MDHKLPRIHGYCSSRRPQVLHYAPGTWYQLASRLSIGVHNQLTQQFSSDDQPIQHIWLHVMHSKRPYGLGSQPGGCLRRWQQCSVSVSKLLCTCLCAVWQLSNLRHMSQRSSITMRDHPLVKAVRNSSSAMCRCRRVATVAAHVNNTRLACQSPVYHRIMTDLNAIKFDCLHPIVWMLALN